MRKLRVARFGVVASLFSLFLASVMSMAPASAESLIPITYKVETSDPVIFITIDDGFVMNTRARDLILSEGIPISLFLKGNIWKDPSHLKFFTPLVEAGAIVGNHTQNHSLLTKDSASHAKSEICTGRKSAEAASGQTVTWLRPPYGSKNRSTQIIAASCGQTRILLWDVSVNGANIATYGGPMKAGDIVLMHWREDLHVSLKKVLAEAKRLGLKPANLGDYLQ